MAAQKTLPKKHWFELTVTSLTQHTEDVKYTRLALFAAKK